jgi:hypothetical protein
LRKAAGSLTQPHGVATPPTIFVHSSFRAGSTWLWNKLRGAPSTLAYREIFHESHSGLQQSAAAALDSLSWDSGHPQTAPYFLEFLQLRGPDGKVSGYDRQMAFQWSIPVHGIEGSLSNSEGEYVQGLIANAQEKRKIPVLTDTRTLGRSLALSRQFPSRTILLHRNLFHQWASYCGQALAGNSYFLDTIQWTMQGARNDPFLSAIDSWFADRETSPYSEMLLQTFLTLHLYLYAHAYASADLVIDITALPGVADLRHAIEQTLAEWTGSPIDLSDVRPSFALSPTVIRSPQGFRDSIDQLAKMIESFAPNKKAAAFMQREKDRALSEWDRYEFLTKGTRRHFIAKLNEFGIHDGEAPGLLSQLRLDEPAIRRLQDSRHGPGSHELPNTDAASTAALTMLDQKTDEIARQQLVIVDRDAEIGTLRTALDAAASAGQRDGARIADLEARLLSAQSEATRLAGEQTESKTELDTLQRAFFALKRTTSGATVDALRSELNQAREALAQKDGEIAEAQSAIEEADRVQRGLRSKVDHFQKNCAELEQTIAATYAAGLERAAEIEALSEALEVSRRRAELLQASVADHERLSRSLHDATTEMNLRGKQLQQLEATVKQHAAEAAQRETELSQLRQRQADADAAQDRLQAELEQTQRAHAEADHANRGLQHRLKSTEDQLQNEIEQVGLLNAALREASETADQSSVREMTLRFDVARLEANAVRLTAAEAQVRQLRETIVDIAAREAEAQSVAALTHQKLSTAEMTIKTLKSSMATEIASVAAALVSKAGPDAVRSMLVLSIPKDLNSKTASSLILDALNANKPSRKNKGLAEEIARSRLFLVESSGLFSAEWYLSRYPDIRTSGADPLTHFVQHGSLEGRSPGPNFDADTYWAFNPDVQQVRAEPFMHYLVHGRVEGRTNWRAPR